MDICGSYASIVDRRGLFLDAFFDKLRVDSLACQDLFTRLRSSERVRLAR